MRAYFILRHLPIGEDSQEGIGDVVDECPAIVRERGGSGRVIAQEVRQKCLRHPTCFLRPIPTRMGKSGIICRKIAATLSSTGTSAWFLHPAEATHGDLGAIREDDVVLALSNSGETEELVRLLEAIRRIGARLIALTGQPGSTLARAADVTLDCSISKEACPLNLVPTASTTAALALGDALALTLSVRKGFREEHFASLHPGGKLGKRLMRVEHVMSGGDAAPRVRRDARMTPWLRPRWLRQAPARGG